MQSSRQLFTRSAGGCTCPPPKVSGSQTQAQMAVTYGVTYVSSPNPSQLLLAISLLKFYLFLVLAALGLHCCVNLLSLQRGGATL